MVGTAEQINLSGDRLPKVDALPKVTGTAEFGADINLPGLLQGRILRSPHAHANIKSIDTSAAEAHPGVEAVVTGSDFPTIDAGGSAGTGEVDISLRYLSELVIARGKALFQGHPVAAVAARTAEIAEEATKLIKVDYEILAPVQDPVEAMAPGAPLLHDDMITSSIGGEADTPSNVALHVELGRGDVEAGFAASDHIVERTYKTSIVHQGYIEPEAETAWYHPDDTIEVWADTQGIFDHRNQLCSLLELEQGNVLVRGTEVGGAFGAKAQTRISPLCIILSKKSGKPVQIVLNRTEVLTATGPGAAATVTVKMGATNDGKMKAVQARFVFGAGAFPGAPVGIGCLCAFAPYQPEAARIDGYDVVTNTPRVAAYRAPGATVGSYAAESAVDEMAKKLGMDPIDFRLANISKTGDQNMNDTEFTTIGIEEMLLAAKAHPAYTAPLKGENAGRGIGIGWWPNGVGVSSCRMIVNPDGTIALIVGTMDLSSTRTGFVQLAAETLGLDPSEVHITTGDTSSIPYSGTAGGSRVTRSMASAIYDASQDIVGQIKERIASKLGVTPEFVDFSNGQFAARDVQDNPMSFREAAKEAVSSGNDIVASASNNPNMRAANGYALDIADVDVDPDTGKATLTRFTAFQDVGKAVNPDAVEGQIQGGAVQGIGWAMNEEYVYDDAGVLQNASLLDYRMPTALDLPRIDCVLIEIPADEGPYGVRGVGEPPIVPPAGAISNAISDAIGARMTQLPLSPERVFWAMQDTTNGGSEAAGD
ncbi:MAG: xanthine dehydrogenase family protein molybdopterin-binding subunit [Dehalococcoidia bacterium]|jgi:CO/xanthine dehydrogenase Mo-binding subunit|nr:xanthine dehydrogenase family protein molybdopterin-binding subunit [Dehalococcoidia bacterium]